MVWVRNKIGHGEILCQLSDIRENVHYHRDVLWKVVLVLRLSKFSHLCHERIRSFLRPQCASSYKGVSEELLVTIDQDKDLL